MLCEAAEGATCLFSQGILTIDERIGDDSLIENVRAKKTA